MNYRVLSKRLKSYKLIKPKEQDCSGTSLNSTLSQEAKPSSPSQKRRSLNLGPRLARAASSYMKSSKSMVSQSSPDLSELLSAVKPTSDSAYNDHLVQTFQAMKFIKSLRYTKFQGTVLNLSKRKGYENKKTVVFDLDETLVHCFDCPKTGQIPIEVPFPNGKKLQASINIRPYAREILAAANQHFEVIVFTASHQCYADQVLDALDPYRQLIHHRLYRDSCVVVNGLHVKDLRILGNRKMSDVVIVDNAAYSFAYQLFNGIPIISWYDDSEDRELFKLIDYLQVLARSPDIRLVNKQTFRLNTFYEDYLYEISQAKENLYN